MQHTTWTQTPLPDAERHRGIAFIPELAEPFRGMRACYAHYTIPFSDVQPYLTEAGSAAVSRILNP